MTPGGERAAARPLGSKGMSLPVLLALDQDQDVLKQGAGGRPAEFHEERDAIEAVGLSE
jgi:hypothetical protein